MTFIKLLFRLYSLTHSALYKKAEAAVKQVGADSGLRQLGNKEGQVSYCPRCGQRPDRDVRHDEAFERAFGGIEPSSRLKDMHFAVELANWLR